ncbi:hypothetical protein D4764_0179010 [Takifugu flavidus]|uniref:Uncharacterized protein n=1 Tax=Takifugu flavidus TaxID=433684 RepID=A0A5C6MN78_9TELE|nr:hypothetical protein D4764_0179010 [Takifugu flavidus]
MAGGVRQNESFEANTTRTRTRLRTGRAETGVKFLLSPLGGSVVKRQDAVGLQFIRDQL